MALKEDYDYTVQHLHRYGGVVRHNALLVTFTHRTNPGGAVAYRTAALEAHSMAYLQRKWPGWFRPNPRRQQELLLRVPSARQQRSVPCNVEGTL